MAINIPHMNPLRFRDTSQDPDWLTKWPNYSNITQRVDYIPGMHATAFFKDFIVGSSIVMQFETTTSYERTISVYKHNEDLEAYQFYQDISGSDITPAGWVSGDIYKYSFTPSESGVYKMIYVTAGIESDEFVVHSTNILKKQLIQIRYYNTENDYGMVFFDGVTQNYTGITYFTGNIQNFEPGNDTSAYTNDRGGTEILKSSPVHGASLNIELLHHSYIENINLIFSCDRITVNGVQYGRSEAIEVQPVEKSDLVNIKIKLTKRETAYYASA